MPCCSLKDFMSRPLCTIKIDPSKPIFHQLAQMPSDGDISFDIGEDYAWENDEAKAKFELELDYQFNQMLRWKATVHQKFGEWVSNYTTNILEYKIDQCPTIWDIPKSARKPFLPALVIGNGPSKDDLHQMDLRRHALFSCWHAAPALPRYPDFVIHSCAQAPEDIDYTWRPKGHIYAIGECCTSPIYYRMLKDAGITPHIYFNPEIPFDHSLATLKNTPMGIVNQGTVMTTCLNMAILMGHTDISLIGVDLTGGGDNESYKILLESYPQRFPHITFRNLSTSQLCQYINKTKE